MNVTPWDYSNEPRAFTEEEVRDKFLDHIQNEIRYWANLDSGHSLVELLDGLAHSILALLDGETNLPGFKVIPHSHPDDKEYHRENDENWYPDDVDIAGFLHELMKRGADL